MTFFLHMNDCVVSAYFLVLNCNSVAIFQIVAVFLALLSV